MTSVTVTHVLAEWVSSSEAQPRVSWLAGFFLGTVLILPLLLRNASSEKRSCGDTSCIRCFQETQPEETVNPRDSGRGFLLLGSLLSERKTRVVL